MDFLPIAVLILFVLVGGIVAVVADELGRRIGKKRVVLHKRIRPKTTARILTFLSGMFITLFTILLIGLASTDMRTLLLHGRHAIEDLTQKNTALRQEQESLTRQNAGLSKDVTSLRTELNTASHTLQAEQAKVKAEQDKLALSRTELLAEQAKASAAAARVNQVTARLGSLNSRFAGVEGKLASAGKLLSQRKNDLAALQKKYDWVYKDYRDQLNQGQKLEIQNGKLAKDIEEAKKEVATQQKNVDDLRGERDRLLQETKDVQAKLDAAEILLASKEDQVVKYQASIVQGLKQSRFQPLMFSKGEEMLRMPIPAGTSKERAAQIIENAIAAARDIAKQRGAKNANNVEYANLVDYPDNTGNTVTKQVQKDMLASEVAGSSEEQVLIVSSPFNVFAEEGVIIEFSHRPNPVVYRPGQTLAEVRVDGREDRSKILRSLDTLGSTVRSRALSDKMIPVQKGNASLGSVTSEQILDLYDQIRDFKRTVRVQAVAKQQTRAANPLVLNFIVK